MELKEKFLPIGSVVLLDGDTKKLMITGFCSVNEDEEDKIYDYSGCLYPEGYLDSDQIFLFNHNQIKELFYLGYQSDEETKFKKVLNEIVGSNSFDKDNDEEIEKLEYL